MGSLAGDLRFRGLVQQTTSDGLLDRLDGDALTAYAGVDPTADSLHVGHLVQVLMLRRLQLAGHRPIALVGGGTGLIGDPSFKNEMRPVLSPDELVANVAALRAQLGRFLDFEGSKRTNPALLVDNREWLGRLGLIEFLRDVGTHVSVNQMIAKESVRARLERAETGISFTEMSYMLLQAFDFLRLYEDHDCVLQVGGSDQWGNITMGVDLVRRVRRSEVHGLTTPLVLKADGTPFGKTASGAVWLDAGRTSPYQLYQFLFRTDDGVVGAYLRYFTFLDHDTIRSLDDATTAHPERREAQRALAREVCTLVHGEKDTARAEHAAGALYSGEMATLDADLLVEVSRDTPTTARPRSALEGAGIALVDALVDTGLAPSRNRARTLVTQGGVSVNDARIDDTDVHLTARDALFGHFIILRKGREYHLLRFE